MGEENWSGKDSDYLGLYEARKENIVFLLSKSSPWGLGSIVTGFCRAHNRCKRIHIISKHGCGLRESLRERMMGEAIVWQGSILL